MGFSIKKGYFKTRWNHQLVPRYRCRDCGRGFSSHSLRSTFGQHRPDLNDPVFQLYASGITQRRMALVLGVNRKTVVRKFLFVARLARSEHERRIAAGELKTGYAQFDEMETFEHSKLKPVTIAFAVRVKTAEVVDFKVARLGYKGPLASLARRKYGPRESKAHEAVHAVLSKLKACSRPTLKLVTDANPQYRLRVPRVLTHAVHCPTQRRISARTNDRKNFDDPMFTLNYTAAKIRNDLSRMARKTWVTTKKLERLQAHLDLYIAWNNGYRLAA